LRCLASLLIFILLAATLTFSSAPAQAEAPPVVHAVMFWMDGCSHCHDVLDYVLPPLQEKYGGQLDILLVEVATMQDIEMLYQVARAYNIPKEETFVPFLILGEHVLIGSHQIPNELPKLIESYLAQGGVDLPSIPVLADIIPANSPASSPQTSDQPAEPDTAPPVDVVPAAPAHMQSDGFMLAIVIMIGMGLALLYSLIALAMGRTFSLPAWGDWLIPTLIVIGIGVAAYLSYVETQSVEAVCGPVGDCNTVQQSTYATLFGFLPVGVLGLLGYLGMLAAWLTRKYLPYLAKPADLAFFGMAFFAVLFSLYLTYLEPFVIRAVCIWCLTSAVIVTLLLLLGMPPAILRFNMSNKDD
jgi:uncharacterized membrane protein